MGKENNLGLSLGAWIRINRVQKEVKSSTNQSSPPRSNDIAQNSSSSSSNNGTQISVEKVKEALRNSRSLPVQNIVKGKLDLLKPLPLIKKEKNCICRTLCEHFFGELALAHKKITKEAKKELANAICQAYPILKCVDSNRPSESDWFFENHGESRGPHTGFIQSWCKNQCGNKDPAKKRPASGSLDVMEEIDELEAMIDENDENKSRTVELMQSTFAYREKVRLKAKHNLIDETGFKFLLKYQGALILKEFDLIFPTERSSFMSIAPSCMMVNEFYENVMFYEVKCLMRIIKYLTQQGCKTKQADPSLSLEEDIVADIMRWTTEQNPTVDLYLEHTTIDHPFILCNAMALQVGVYFVVVNKNTLSETSVFEEALEMLLKVYTVLNFTIPPRLSKTFEFLNIILFNTKNISRNQRVDALIRQIKSSQPQQD